MCERDGGGADGEAQAEAEGHEEWDEAAHGTQATGPESECCTAHQKSPEASRTDQLGLGGGTLEGAQVAERVPGGQPVLRCLPPHAQVPEQVTLRGDGVRIERVHGDVGGDVAAAIRDGLGQRSQAIAREGPGPGPGGGDVAIVDGDHQP